MSYHSFASDNNAGVHPEVLRAMEAANAGHALAYGEDEHTARAVARVRAALQCDAQVFFVFGGTAANVLGLAAVTRPHHAVICAESAHINVDECGAPERFTGCKLLAIRTGDGKLTPELIAHHLHGFGNQHHVQPKVVSVTQATELGTVYTPEELRAIADCTRAHGLALHMDGARLANAAASLGVGLADITTAVGVDVLSLGAAKSGAMYGEAVVLFAGARCEDFAFIRKQGMQLASKMRFIAVQFEALLTDDLWLRNAAHANRMARLLADELSTVPRVRITQEVQTNAVFAVIPAASIPVLQRQRFFWVWNEERSEVRWMTSFDTTEEDVREFVTRVREAVAGPGIEDSK